MHLMRSNLRRIRSGERGQAESCEVARTHGWNTLRDVSWWTAGDAGPSEKRLALRPDVTRAVAAKVAGVWTVHRVRSPDLRGAHRLGLGSVGLPKETRAGLGFRLGVKELP